METMMCKWSDSFTQLCNYLNISLIEERDKKDITQASRLELMRSTLAHWFTLMSAMAVCQLRGEDIGAAIPTIRVRRHFSYQRNYLRMSTFKESGRTLTLEQECEETTQKSWRDSFNRVLGKPPQIAPQEYRPPLGTLQILGTVLDEEAHALDNAPDKVIIVIGWITMLVTEVSNRGWIKCPPPILSRLYQETSNGLASYHQAVSITKVPFPFPFTQMLQLLLLVFLFLCPCIIGQLTKGYLDCGLLSFIVNTIYWGLNEICAELENPYGEDINDLPLEDMHHDFVDRLESLVASSENNRKDVGEMWMSATPKFPNAFLDEDAAL